jgi:3-hydroxybutyryl-CoA dehydrogenase
MAERTVCVCGAGTMGSGIAQVAAHSGFNTILFDVDPAGLEKAKASIDKSLQVMVSRDKISAEKMATIMERINFTDDINSCRADYIIEAIVERTDVKVKLFNRLAEINGQGSTYASNTSSLSITELQEQFPYPSAFAGMHFFNPAPLMKLVEVVKGARTGSYTIDILVDLCKQMNKTAVVCSDAPGFIVNRVARHYYLEALKMAEEGVIPFEDIDTIMEGSGFKMGPFRLMDMIGMDINLSVSEGIYEAFDNAERFKPSALQRGKVATNKLGRKTGEGFYKY